MEPYHFSKNSPTMPKRFCKLQHLNKLFQAESVDLKLHKDLIGFFIELLQRDSTQLVHFNFEDYLKPVEAVAFPHAFLQKLANCTF